MDVPPLLVIGSNSISGASFVRHAIEEGRRVIGVSRSAELPGCFLPYRWAAEAAQARFSFHQMDLNHHAAGILDLVSDARCACVVNFAAQSMVAESWLNPEQWYQTNVVANVRLHDGLRKIPSLRRYVHISTPEVYGSCEGTVRENETYRPSTPYAASRAACDLHLRTFFQRYDFPVCLTRAANVYGPGQQLYRIIPRTVMAVLTGEKLQLQGGGHSVRSFIHLDDVAEATLRVADAGTSGETYHISTSRFVSIRELVQIICEMMGKEFSDVVDVVEDRPGKDAAYLLDSSKCRSQLGWEDRVGLEEGIAGVIAWARSRQAELANQTLTYQHKT
ncbi:MAG: GDP-mannose 4,6-dehydratase [Verrucomicrobiae bacterium]